MKLTKKDMEAIKKEDSNYILEKGSKFYMDKDYENAVSYYHLAGSMGNDQALCNLGYYYLDGRCVEVNLDLAIAYFELASHRHNVDACYRLGDIYSSDKWKVKDNELSIHYYRMAANYLIGEDWKDDFNIAYTDSLTGYPNLCYALAKEMMPGGHMKTDIEEAYQFLKHAKKGYILEIRNGVDSYDDSYKDVLKRLNNKIFDDVREEVDGIFDDDVSKGEYTEKNGIWFTYNFKK